MTSLIDTPNREIKGRIRRGEPITVCGLTFYPITMERYEEFLQCKTAIALRQSTFPVKYLSKDYLSAIFAMELDAVAKDKKGTGILFNIIEFLILALRIAGDRKKIMQESISFRTDTREIECIRLPLDNGEIAEISPMDFSTRIRPILAQQNGIELPNEMQNLDLVRSNEYLQSQKQRDVKLKVDTNDLIAAVAYQSKIRERDILEWTVLEFENRRRAIERDKEYSVYKTAELSGMVKFPKGNPVPSWCFDVIDDSLGTASLEELGKRLVGAKQK